MNRDEPRILADLIRLADRKERAYDEWDRNAPCSEMAAELKDEAELIEQARAALHRYVVAQGKRDIAKRPGPLTWLGIGALYLLAMYGTISLLESIGAHL